MLDQLKEFYPLFFFKLYKTGVICFMGQNVISGRFHQETEKHTICVMGFFSHRRITLILTGRSAIQCVCLFDVYLFCALSFNDLKSPLLKNFFSGLNSYKAETSS